jgi:hypothetical protein
MQANTNTIDQYLATVSEVATWRTKEAGNVRVRMVEYSPGYVADHWCERGHVVLVLEGELVTHPSRGPRAGERQSPGSDTPLQYMQTSPTAVPSGLNVLPFAPATIVP